MTQQTSHDVVIAGGGPAGMMAGLLFARAGVDVMVLEKHADFFRDFRGDTVHPATMEILDQLGWLEEFLELPHNRIESARFNWEGKSYAFADFYLLDTVAPFIAMMPQWDLLNFLREKGRAFSGFHLQMCDEVTDVVFSDGRASGVTTAQGDEWSATRLVIMADGRGSLVRSLGLLPLEDLGAPIDVLWFRLNKDQAGTQLRGEVRDGHMLVLFDRGSYWQCAFLIAKGDAADWQKRPISEFRALLRKTVPDVTGLASALPDWDSIKVLSVSLDRLERWHRPGLLAIGDAAHAMSPVGGVGINLAVQDAVCAANILAGPIAAGENPDGMLAKVQDRRLLPTRVVQTMQQFAHKAVISPILAGKKSTRAPLPLRLTDRLHPLQKLPARLVGFGFRREKLTAPSVSTN